MRPSWKTWIGVSVALLAVSGGARAQDPEEGDYAQYEDTGRSSARARRGRSSRSSLYLEMQGRLDAFNIPGLEAVVTDSGSNGSTPVQLPAIPYMSLGVRMMDARLFVGLGLGFGSISSTSDPDALPEQGLSRSAFMVAPLATYDLLVRRAAALYALALLKMGIIGSGTNKGADDPEGGFWWGLNLGVGIRGDITEHVSAFTEFGWGFSHGLWRDNAQDDSRFGQGLFGVLGLGLKLGL